MSHRAAAAVVALSLPTAAVLAVGLGTAVPAVLVVVAALVAGSRVPRLWRSTGRAVVAGAVAGVLVLGPGYRLAMRVVALVDADGEPTFTWAGTLFVVVGIGVTTGALATGWTSLVVRALGLSRRGWTVLLSAVVLLQLLADSEIIDELVGLGAGLWMNLPMFVGVTALFAALAVRWARPTTTSGHDTGPTSHRPADRAMMVGGRAERSA